MATVSAKAVGSVALLCGKGGIGNAVELSLCIRTYIENIDQLTDMDRTNNFKVKHFVSITSGLTMNASRSIS